MDFFDKTGPMAVGSRLRMLSESVSREAARIYAMGGVDLKPKWFPVFFALSRGECKAVTDIAAEIGHTHPSVCKIAREMAASGLLAESRGESDARKNVLRLSEKGSAMSGAFEELCGDVDRAVRKIGREAGADLWAALGEWERLLAEKSLFERVKGERAARARRSVKIAPYSEKYRKFFRDTGVRWISEHWKPEPADIRVLSDPKRHILDRGGRIFIALFKGEPAGVCALQKLGGTSKSYGLSKLAVLPEFRGLGIGRMLCRTAIAEARKLGGGRVFLESNTVLKPAIKLYRSLGFREIPVENPEYERVNIQMELPLKRRASVSIPAAGKGRRAAGRGSL